MDATASTASTHPSSATLESTLAGSFPNSALLKAVDVTDGNCVGGKYQLVVVWDGFDHVGLVDRHRMVNKALTPHMESIHAVQMKTYTVAEAKAKGVLS